MQDNNSNTGILLGTKSVACIIYNGHHEYQVKVTAEIKDGIGCHITGIPDKNIKELLLRVLTARQSIGYTLPSKKIIVSVDGFSDGWSTKELDLPVAVSIYALQKGVFLDTDGVLLTGGLSLTGELNEVNGAVHLSSFAKRHGKKIFLPKRQYLANLSKHYIGAIPADNLREIINYLDNF